MHRTTYSTRQHATCDVVELTQSAAPHQRGEGEHLQLLLTAPAQRPVEGLSTWHENGQALGQALGHVDASAAGGGHGSAAGEGDGGGGDGDGGDGAGGDGIESTQRWIS